MLCARAVALVGSFTFCLAGCSPSEPDAAEQPARVSCSVPLSSQPELLDAPSLAFCQAEALGKIAGYVQEDAVDGEVISRSRVNINPLEVEISSLDSAGKVTSRAILVEGNTFVQREGKWVQAMADSSDENLAYQATMPVRFEALLNPQLRASGTDPNLRYTVSGTDTVNGQPVTVLKWQLDSEADTMESRLYIRDDYLVMKSESVYTDPGREHTRTSTLVEVDVPQDIANPRFEDAG